MFLSLGGSITVTRRGLEVGDMAPLFDKADTPLLKTWVVKRLEDTYVIDG